MQITIDKRGIDFDSPHDNTTVCVAFKRLVENGQLDSEFAQSLYQGAKRRQSFTFNQLPWVHVLVAQIEGTPTKPNAGVNGPALTNLHKIHEHLTICRERRDNGGKGLKNPTVRLATKDQNLCFKLAGKNSRHFGKVSVAESHIFGEGQFYGWIDADGNMESKGMPTTAKTLILEFGQDPVQVIGNIGRESGMCCYCNLKLTTVGSKITGYGKKCADNYGASYPAAAEIRDAIRQNPDVLEGASDRDRWTPQP
jgi:hypothetical protein